MNLTQRNLIGIAGVFCSVFGTAFMVPSFLKEHLGLASFAATLVVIGILLLAVAFGYEHEPFPF